jgi:hypothetical protein
MKLTVNGGVIREDGVCWGKMEIDFEEWSLKIAVGVARDTHPNKTQHN